MSHPPPASPTTRPPFSTAPAAPIDARRRVAVLDAVRGFALLGIFTVNIMSFANPLGRFLEPTAPPDLSGPDRAVWYLVTIFTEGKFYPLFSMMFGMGLVLQMRSLEAAGRPFAPLYLRRLAVLAVFGLVHGLLLWYGDILFVYSLAGACLLLLRRCRPSTLALVGALLLALSVVLGGFMSAISVPPAPTTAVSTNEMPTGVPSDETPDLVAPSPAPDTATSEDRGAAPERKGPFFRLLDTLNARRDVQMHSHEWLALETEAYRDGPFLDATLFRAMTFLMYLAFMFLGFFPHIVAMFLFGAALLKAGLFEPGRLRWHRALVAAAVLAGLPLCLLAAFADRFITDPRVAFGVAASLTLVGGPLMSLGYLGAITLAANTAPGAVLVRLLAPVGRMALTNYLMQTVLATGIMYHWGLGYFGRVSLSEGLLIVFCIYTLQVALSHAWLRVFRFGPMEWLWRSLTYLRWQPMLRGRDPAAA